MSRSVRKVKLEFRLRLGGDTSSSAAEEGRLVSMLILNSLGAKEMRPNRDV